MSETKVNSDLLKCENHFYRESNEITNSLLITKKAQKSAINCNQKPLKTEKISSNVLSRAKDFLQMTKDKPIAEHTCDLVGSEETNDETNECPNDGKPVVEMDFVLFANKDHSDSEEETDDSSESSDDSDDDEDDDCEQQSDNTDKCVTK